MNGRERILAHLQGNKVDQLPVMPITMQFACDLIGARYRDYETDCRVLAEAQARVAEQFGFDYVNTMSDPGREAADCGAVLEFLDDAPAALVEEHAVLADKSRLVTLRAPDPLGGGRMTNGIEGVALLRKKVGLEKAVEGWIEGPMAEAADLRGINTIMLDFFDDADFVRDLFAFVVEMELRFAKAQIEAGADLIGIGDAAVSLIGPELYREFVWSFEKKLVDSIHDLGTPVRLHICGNTKAVLSGMGQLGCDIVDLDFLAPMEEGRSEMGPTQILLGNVNPVATVRGGQPSDVIEAIRRSHRAAGARYIVGPGCEIPRDTPHANVHAFAEYARSCGAAYGIEQGSGPG